MGMVALLVVVFGAASSAWGVYQKERESKKLRTQAEAERADLLERQGRLEGDIAELGTDRGLEEALREQYALAERGEQLIVIVEPPEAEPIQATSTVREWLSNLFWWW